jgi:hypothetical protein
MLLSAAPLPNPPEPRAPGLTRASRSTRRNLRELHRIEELVGRPTARQALRVHRLAHLPRMLKELYVLGYERLPLRTEPAPILAFSHKKIHDVLAITEFMAGRPLERFHDLTFIAQAGIFSALYAYRDMVPAFCKTGPLAPALRPLAIAFARIAGRFLRGAFADVHAYPVYREGRDVPANEADFNAPEFAGPAITGRDYADYVKFANRETRASLIHVQQDMDEHNRCFFIMPEGGYRYDGSIAPLFDFLGVFAYRKQAPTIFGSLSYDELCPDALGRINAFLLLSPPAAPPARKDDVQDFLSSGRATLRAGTVILASHIIAACVRDCVRENSAPFTLADFAERFELCFAALARRRDLRPGGHSPDAWDPGLANAGYRARRLADFFRYGTDRYFRRAGGRAWSKGGKRYVATAASVGRFARSERTVSDIDWNYNHIRHLFE